MPRLVLHADDLGMNRAVSQGILHGFRHGLLTSTSLLANAPDAAWALQQWRSLVALQAGGELASADARRRLADPAVPFDLGVHLNLTQGQPLSGERYPAELLDAEGRFPSVFVLFKRLRTYGDKHRAAIRAELIQQIAMALDHRLHPTHLNGHQYVELMPLVSSIVLELLEKFQIGVVRVAREPGLLRTTAFNRLGLTKWPLGRVKRWFAKRFVRLIDTQRVAHPQAYFGSVHAGGIDTALLRLFLRGGRKYQTVEVGLHPGAMPDAAVAEQPADGWHDPLAQQRPGELAMLESTELVHWLEKAGWRLGRLSLL